MADTPNPIPPTRLDAAAIARQQRRLARAEAPWLHREIAQRMAERLPILRLQPRRVIDWWSAAGAGSDLLVARYPQAELLSVEPPDRHTAILADTGAWWRQLGRMLPGRKTPIVLPDEHAPPPAQLLWSNMMLHWCSDLTGLLARWHAALEVDGMLMFSCLGPDTLDTLRQLYRTAGWSEPTCDFMDMHDLGDALVAAGFADPVMDMEVLTLTWDQSAPLLTELRTLGGNTSPRRHAGMRTPRWKNRLDRALADQLAGPDGRLHLKFEIVYGHAVRAITRAPVKANTEISLQTLREMTRKRSGGATP